MKSYPFTLENIFLCPTYKEKKKAYKKCANYTVTERVHIGTR